MIVKFKGIKPTRATDGSAGYDLVCNEEFGIGLFPGLNIVVDTGTFIEIPKGYVGKVCPRSGLAAKKGITVLNAPGIIDSDYRGEIKVILVNHGLLHAHIERGDRIAQLLIQKVEYVEFIDGDLSETDRGEGGLGSTGA
mgnify:CR=1 FL=1